MVDEFMVCVDRIIIATTCFDDDSSVNTGVVVAGGNRERESVLLIENANSNVEINSKKIINNNGCGSDCGGGGGGEGCSKSIIRECRICQEEDEENDMETPCACNGTLKFAHRKCIQRWCNKKGDITCEICNKVFSPNYTLPPARSNPDVMAIDIRQAWGPGMDIRNPHFLAFAAAERQFLQSEYDDYAIASSGSLACFRYVAIILMLLLLIRQTLMVTRDFTMVQDPSTFFNFQISLLQLAAFLLPCYVMARTWYMIQCRRRRQGSDG